MIIFNLKLALRNLVKNRIYSILIIGGFAIGFATCIFIGLFYHTETSVNKGFTNHEKIYRIYDVKKNVCNINWDLFPILKNNFPEVEEACPIDYATGRLYTVKNEQTHSYTEIRHLLTTTNNFFPMFSVKLEEQLGENPFMNKESIVISKSVAKNLFGIQNPLGQQVVIKNNFTGTITGIFDKLPANSSFQADVILNNENEKFRFSSTISNGKRYNPTNHFIMLNNAAASDIFISKLNNPTINKALDIDSLALQKLDNIYLSQLTVKDNHAKGNPILLKIFISIAVLIIILSSINYLNYSISMKYAKLKEFGINRTNGASWKDLARFSFVEIALSIFLSLIISIVLVLIALPYSQILFGKDLMIEKSDWLAIAPVFLIFLALIVIANSIVPVYILSKFKVTEFLSGSREKHNKKHYGKQVLLVFQMTASIALIAVVITIFKQLNYVKYSDLGFNQELLLRIDIPDHFKKNEALRQELSKLPYVKNISLSQGCPGMINNKYGSNTGKNSFKINCIPVGENYLKTMNIELLDGRDFLKSDMQNACLINEEALRQYGWENFEGKKFNNAQEGGFNVIGIIKDFKFKSNHQTIEPLALLFDGAPYANVLSVRLAPGKFGEQIDEIKKIWKTISPYEPMNFVFYDDFFQSMYSKEEKMAGSITFFSFIAIVLTCMGVLGQIFMICLSRIKEIGIRKINGARISEVLLMLNIDFIKWVTIAFVFATPIAHYAMNKWLENFAYKTTLSWWIFALSGILASCITLITVSWQSWKAATRNPVEALRYE